MSSNRDPLLAKVLVQPNGAGNAWLRLGQGVRAAAFSGGGRSVESLFEGLDYAGSVITSSPERVSGDLTLPSTHAARWRQLWANYRQRCFHNVAVLYDCPHIDFAKFKSGFILVDAISTSTTMSADSMIGNEQVGVTNFSDVFSLSAAIREEIQPLAHARVQVNLTTGTVHHVIAVGVSHCGGACGAPATGEDEFIAVASMPGVGEDPPTVSALLYTRDSWANATTRPIGGIANGSAIRITEHGNRLYIAVSGVDEGLYTVAMADIRSGAALTALPVASVTGGVLDVRSISENMIVAVGDAGEIWVSDSGYAFSSVQSGVSTPLNRIAAGRDGSPIWIGGDGGVLLRLLGNRIAETITIAAVGSDDITALAVPHYRENTVVLGTDTGKIFITNNAYDAIPLWDERQFDKPAGGSSVVDLEFAGAMGVVLYVVQTNASAASRVLIDYSGGNLAQDAVNIGEFASPVNSGFNAIAAVSPLKASIVGNPNGGNGFIGLIASVTTA